LLNDPTLYNEANETIGKLRRISDQINDQIGSGKGTIGKLLKDEELYNRANSLIKRLDETSARLERAMAKVERGEGNLGQTAQ
jgi:phospholipid/cholesterol/gamma-HCH transport system substrate-binding protein